MEDEFANNKSLDTPETASQSGEQQYQGDVAKVFELTLLSKEVPGAYTTMNSSDQPVADGSRTANARFGLNISRHLKAPKITNIKPNIISYEKACAGITINIPGSHMMNFGDTLTFYWGLNESSTPLLLRNATAESVVRVLCVSYNFLSHLQYGLVDVYYEVYRDRQLIGTSPATRVTVNPEEPRPPRPKHINGVITSKGPSH